VSGITTPTLKQVLRAVDLTTGNFRDRRVLNQMGGFVDGLWNLSQFKGATCGLWTALTGGWNTTPVLNGYAYKGYNNITADINNNATITYENAGGFPTHYIVDLGAVANGSGGGDKTHEVRFPGLVEQSGTYKAEFSIQAKHNSSYNNARWEMAVASFSSGFHQGASNLDFIAGNVLLYLTTSGWNPGYAGTFNLTTARPYVTFIFYLHMYDGGSWKDPAEHFRIKLARVYKV